MNNLNAAVAIFLACISLNACAQKANKNLLKEKDMTFIENLADSLYLDLEEFPLEGQINYDVYISTKNSYDLLVNDYLIGYDYGRIKQKMGYFANSAILKSGKQKLQLKFYPEYKKGKFLETLANDDYLNIIVERYVWNKEGWKDKKTEILKYELPKRDKNGNDIDYSEKTELIIDLEFEAQVPYKLNGWTDGIVFHKEDSLQLKQKLVVIYQQIIDDYKNKRFEKIKKESILSDSELIRYYYYPKKNFIEKFKDYNYEKDMNMFPLENYDIFFYGNQRIVTLRRLDIKYRGDSPIIERYIGNNGKNRIRTLEFYFYQPQGSDKLVLIR